MDMVLKRTGHRGGNPIVVSGNHNHTGAESVYPAGRISAYVLPGG